MKIIYVTCNISVKEPLTELLEKNDIENYQVLEQVMAKPVKGLPRLNTAVWPGYNCSILMQFDNNERAGEILDILKSFNTKAANESELITVCSWQLDDYFYE